jgi:hypothetical protein
MAHGAEGIDSSRITADARVSGSNRRYRGLERKIPRDRLLDARHAVDVDLSVAFEAAGETLGQFAKLHERIVSTAMLDSSLRNFGTLRKS